MATPGLEAVTATTYKNYNKKFADNVTNHLPFLKYLQTKAQVMVSGGDTIVEELMYGEGNGGSYSGADVMQVSKPEGLSAAEYNWKQVYATITYDGNDRLRNSGSEKIQDLVKARIMQAEATISNRVGTMVFGDGTGNSGKDVLGVNAIISTTPTTGVLGGINRGTYSFWRNKVRTSAGSFATNGLTYISQMIRDCTRGTDKPDLLVMGSDVFGYLEGVANGRAQFMNPQLGELGFDALKVNGVNAIWDSQCPSGRVYVVNSKYLKFKVHKDRNYKMGEFIEPADQDVSVAKILLAAQLTCSNCSLQGVIDGFTA
ncbi:MAG: phage major capsid protein [Pseudobdellovibrionaceae bacterium]